MQQFMAAMSSGPGSGEVRSRVHVTSRQPVEVSVNLDAGAPIGALTLGPLFPATGTDGRALHGATIGAADGAAAAALIRNLSDVASGAPWAGAALSPTVVRAVAPLPGSAPGTVATSRPARPSVVKPMASGRVRVSRDDPMSRSQRTRPRGRRRSASAADRVKSRVRRGVAAVGRTAARASRSACRRAQSVQAASRAWARATSVALRSGSRVPAAAISSMSWAA